MTMVIGYWVYHSITWESVLNRERGGQCSGNFNEEEAFKFSKHAPDMT